MRLALRAGSYLLLLVLVALPLDARVLRVEIASRTDVLNGKLFGDAGACERIIGRVYFSLPVANPHNRQIVDLANAVNLKDGEVEFSADFVAVRPRDAKKANGSMLLQVPNRGRASRMTLIEGGDDDLATDNGDAWLLRRGFTVVSLGWQWDATGPGAARLYAPVAQENGKTITGLVRGDLMPSRVMPDIPLGHLMGIRIGGSEYPVSDPHDSRNVLTVRDSRNGPRQVIPASEWQFAHLVDGKLVPSDRFIHLIGGFQPGKIYEYVYVAADPVVAGVGFAAFRDFASYTKHAPDAIAPAVRVYGQGNSRPVASCAISCIKVSMPMKKVELLSMVSWSILREPGAAASIIGLPNHPAMHSPLRPFSSQQIFPIYRFAGARPHHRRGWRTA